MTNILQTIESSTGHSYKKAASTKGGEYKGPCPWCQGEDRFSIHPNSNHWVCRRCKKAGDTLQFLMDFHNMSYYDACASAGIEPSFQKTFLIDKIAKRLSETDAWLPRECPRPSLTWQAKAEAIAFQSFKHLLSGSGKPHRDYLHGRGLTIETIKKARIGYNPGDISFDRESWGLPAEITKTGKPKGIWIPEGFIIPMFQDGRLLRIRVRQADPGAGQKYILVAGSSTEYMSFPRFPKPGEQPEADDAPVDPAPAFLLEAELDAILCNQEFGDTMDIYAIGNTTARPDLATHEKLITAKQIILCLDNDAAGAEETTWWKNQYGADKVESHPVPIEYGKDPGEAYQHGLDLKTWGRGIAQYQPPLTSLKQPEKRAETAIAKTPEIVEQIEQIEQIEPAEPAEPAEPVNSLDPVPSLPISPPRPSKLCRHGYYCVSAKEGVCLVSGLRVFDLSQKRCPRDYWYSYEVDGGIIEQIILGVAFRK